VADIEERDTPEGREGPPPGVRGMAIVRWALIIVMACVAVGSVIYSFDLFSPRAEPGAAARYYCPMHPQIVQDHPGDCPICNMTLVPMPSAGGSPGAGAQGDVPGLTPVELSPERVQRIGMRTAVASERELSPSLRAVGVVSVDEGRVARVHARFSGWVERLLVKTTGQQVNAGQVLASIYNVELLPAQQELLAALRWQGGPDLAPAPGGVKLGADARARLELMGMTPRQIDRLAETGTPTRTLDVTAPIAGTVTQKSAVQGSYLEPGTELFEITDLSKVWVVGEVYTAESSRLAVGQEARVEVGALPGGFDGKVTFINPTLNATTRALGFRVELDNPRRELRPGMFADVVVQLESRRGLVIPAEALVDTGDQQYVFLARDGGRFEPRRVRAGARVMGEVEILDGLRAGDVVVTTANFLIDSESRLRAAIEDLGAVAPSPPATTER
jgi:membrane fusion protein, copper/silver efflux system